MSKTIYFKEHFMTEYVKGRISRRLKNGQILVFSNGKYGIIEESCIVDFETYTKNKQERISDCAENVLLAIRHDKHLWTKIKQEVDKKLKNEKNVSL